jgi:hypothetical protein
MPLTLAATLVPADLILFDNLISFTQVNPVRVTDHPVEAGSDVSDNAQVMPTELIFVVQVTKSPVGLPNPTAVELATSWFERNRGKQVDVIAPAGIFKGYLITRAAYDQAPGDRVFNVTAREVRIASAIAVPIPPRLPNPAASGLESASNAGVQAPVPVPPPPPTSFLAVLAAAVP